MGLTACSGTSNIFSFSWRSAKRPLVNVSLGSTAALSLGNSAYSFVTGSDEKPKAEEQDEQPLESDEESCRNAIRGDGRSERLMRKRRPEQIP